MLRRMCKHSPCRIGYCDRRDRKKLVLGNRAKCPAPAPMRNARRHPRHAAVAGATKENSSIDSSPGGVRETAAQCFESGGDFNPISAEQLRQLGLGLFNEGAQGVPVDAQYCSQGEEKSARFRGSGAQGPEDTERVSDECPQRGSVRIYG